MLKRRQLKPARKQLVLASDMNSCPTRRGTGDTLKPIVEEQRTTFMLPDVRPGTLTPGKLAVSTTHATAGPCPTIATILSHHRLVPGS